MEFTYELSQYLNSELEAHINGVIYKKLSDELQTCETERKFIVDRFYKLQKEISKRRMKGNIDFNLI